MYDALDQNAQRSEAEPRPSPRLGQNAGRDLEAKLPLCDVRWAVQHAAKEGYGISYSDNQIRLQMEKVSVLVTELIEADMEYNLAKADFRAAHARLGLDDHEPLDSMHPAAVRLQAAMQRRSRVLTRALGRES